ncbi:MAG: hypothetical protein A2Z20_01870 [Bdellovibrionales bacterium RBG_16_40_8]|nr:MAG: hypothetical protein A2Z20_01870 [Bdellovibrionales bacterium RBG_16_40_8]
MINSKKIKIITLNIHKGFLFSKKNSTLDKIKSNIRELGADLVCLQEVVGQHPELAKKAQFEFLADQIWSHYAYGKNAIYSKGHHGNAILSHFPFIKHENFDISNYKLERRGILHGIVQSPVWQNTRLHVMTLHLDLMSWGRKRQLEKLCRLIEHHVPQDEPLIVCGDFNDWREQVSNYLKEKAGLTEAHLNQCGCHARTFPASLPLLKLDRLYVRGLEVESISLLNSGPWRELSDHLALFAELRF